MHYQHQYHAFLMHHGIILALLTMALQVLIPLWCITTIPYCIYYPNSILLCSMHHDIILALLIMVLQVSRCLMHPHCHWYIPTTIDASPLPYYGWSWPCVHFCTAEDDRSCRKLPVGVSCLPEGDGYADPALTQGHHQYLQQAPWVIWLGW